MLFSQKQSRCTKFALAGIALICTFSLAIGTCALNYSPAYATPGEEKQAEAEEALTKLNEMQAELDVASDSYYQAVAEQEAAEEKVAEAQQRIEEANARIAVIQNKLATRARAMYCGGNFTVLDLIFGCASWTEFTTTWDLLNTFNENDAEMVQETKDLRAEVERQKVVLDEQARIAAEKAEVARQIKEDAEATVADMQAIYDNLSAEAAALLEEERLAREAAAAAEAEQNTGSNSSNTSGDYNNNYQGVADAGSVVGRAWSYVGNAEYVWGACAPGRFDCSGFVSYCLTGQYTRLGTTLTFLGWTEVSDPQPGDICVNSGHCGIYIGGGQMIHAASPSQGVCVGGVQSGMIYVRY